MKHILVMTTLALLALGGSHPAHGQAPVEAWVQHYEGASASAMAVDGSGNVFVAGSVFLGEHEYEGVITYDYDYATIKYSGAGVQLWARYYGQPDKDIAYAMTIDGSGNVIVTGDSEGDYATIKYSGEGMALWTNRYCPGSAYAVAVDSSDNVFVTGYSGGDYATIKYSGEGVALWTNRYDGPGNNNDFAYAIAVDSSGNVFVTGSSYGGDSHNDYATIKYSGAGVALWTNRYAGPGNNIDYASALAVDGSGNVLVTGNSFGSGSGYDYATIKYSGAGVPLWTNRYNGPGNGEERAGANSIAADASGNVLVTGYSAGNGGGFDYATIKYSGEGVPLWTNRYNGPGNAVDQAFAVTVDGSDNVFVTGHSVGIGTGYDLATIKYSGTGVALWTNRYAGPGNSDSFASGADVVVNSSGDVFITGSDLTTIKYSILPLLTITRTMTNTVAISWPSPSTGFTLQENTNGIATANWSNVLTLPIDNGTTKTVTVNLPAGNRFYRLRKS